VTEPELASYRMPNGLEVACVSQSEAAALYQEIFVQRCWLDGGVRLSDGDTVVDAGANIGLTTLFFHHERRNVRLLSFEPAPIPFLALRRNVAAHGVSATCRPVALGSSAYHTTMTYYPGVTAMSGLYAEPRGDAQVTGTYMRNCGFHEEDIADIVPDEYQADPIEVEVRTLSAEVAQAGLGRIALLKIDVEKSEIDVLKGIDSRTWDLVDQVVIEVHDLGGALRTVCETLSAEEFTVRTWQQPLMRGTGIHSVAGNRGER